MKRLFVALTVPEPVCKQLTELQPEPVDHIRLVKPENIHLTLHFIGQADPGKITNVLKQVSARQFELGLKGPGVFRSRNGSVTFWIGVKESKRLLELHHEIALALAQEGYQKEPRKYCPHITLARCKKKLSSRIIDKFLQQEHCTFPALPITGFGLYSSSLSSAGPVYNLEQDYPLDL